MVDFLADCILEETKIFFFPPHLQFNYLAGRALTFILSKLEAFQIQ